MQINTPYLIEAFLEMLSVERNASKNTLEAYARDLREHSEYVKDALAADEKAIRHWLQQLNKKQLSAKSMARKLSCIKQFYLFLYTEKHRTNNPAQEVESPKTGKSLPKYLTQEEVNALIAAAAQEPKLLAMLELLYASGLRVSELISLRKSSLRIEAGELFLFVRGKGAKERLLPLGKFACAALEEYLQRNEIEDYLFPAAKNGSGKHISRQGFALLLKQLAIAANLDPAKVSPHVLRHSFASHMLEHGADLRIVQELLGHENIVTTEIYTHIQQQKLREVVEKFHPLSER